MPEPRRDPFAATMGEDLEDLSGIAAAQPWEPSGVGLDRESLALLLGATGRRVKVGRRDDDGARRLRTLREADLVDDRGTPTEVAGRVRQVVGQPEHHVRVEAVAGLAPYTFDAYSRGDVTVAVSTVSPTQWPGAGRSGAEVAEMADRVWLQELPTAWLPAEVAGWLGLGPAWAWDTEPGVVPVATITARVEDPDTPAPDGADERLRHVWAQPWFAWTAVSAAGDGSSPRGVAAVSVEGCGQFRMVGVDAASSGSEGGPAAGEPAEELARFGAWLSEQVWLALVGLCLE